MRRSAVKSAKRNKANDLQLSYTRMEVALSCTREAACDLLNLYESGHCATDSYAHEYHMHKSARVSMLSFLVDVGARIISVPRWPSMLFAAALEIS